MEENSSLRKSSNDIPTGSKLLALWSLCVCCVLCVLSVGTGLSIFIG